MNRINAEFAGLALLAATLSVAGTLASTGAPLYATTPLYSTTFESEIGYPAPMPQGADALTVRYGAS